MRIKPFLPSLSSSRCQGSFSLLFHLQLDDLHLAIAIFQILGVREDPGDDQMRDRFFFIDGALVAEEIIVAILIEHVDRLILHKELERLLQCDFVFHLVAPSIHERSVL